MTGTGGSPAAARAAAWPGAAALVAACFAVALSAAPAGAQDGSHVAFESLVAAERAFSALSVEKGMKEAFLTFLADDGVVFRPTATNGKQAWSARENPNATLIWEPEFAGISAAGDLGWTTGPWELRLPAEAGRPPQHGHFVSVWRRLPGNPWRVVADLGATHGPPEQGVGTGFVPQAWPAPGNPNGGRKADPAKLDRGLSKATRSRGIAGALASRARPDVRFNRDGAFPHVGIEAARAALDTLAGVLRYTPQGSGLASSRDVGYTYGIAERFAPASAKAPADTNVYLHVWSRDAGGRWRLAVAVLNPLRR
jgi:ketosteroid isomerase-like protein